MKFCYWDKQYDFTEHKGIWFTNTNVHKSMLIEQIDASQNERNTQIIKTNQQGHSWAPNTVRFHNDLHNSPIATQNHQVRQNTVESKWSSSGFYQFYNSSYSVLFSLLLIESHISPSSQKSGVHYLDVSNRWQCARSNPSDEYLVSLHISNIHQSQMV